MFLDRLNKKNLFKSRVSKMSGVLVMPDKLIDPDSD